jgi:cytidine deaminase
MKKKNVNISFEEYADVQELKREDRKLFIAAISASQSSYSPYSKFKVGAAVLLANGKVVKGSNQENAAYPSGLCAERVAIFWAGSEYPGVKIKAIAVVGYSKISQPLKAVSPCGACRQVMVEYEKLYEQNIRFIMAGDNNKIVIAESVKSLLPFAFLEF